MSGTASAGAARQPATLAKQLTGTAARAVTIRGLAALRLAASAPAGRVAAAPAVLVPGYTGSKEDFAPVLDALAAAGHDVTAIDLPGQYQSPGPQDLAQYSPDALAGVVREVARTVGAGRPVHLVGHSYGGLVARAAVLAEPGAFASLTLMGSGPAAIGGRRRMMIERLEPALPTIGLAGVYEQMQQLYAQLPGFQPPTAQLAEFLRRRFLAGSPVMLQGMGLALRNEPDRTDRLAALRRPVLVLYGATDDAWPPEVQAAMAGRLGARAAVIADAAHSPAAENPGATVEALTAFWREVDQATSASSAAPPGESASPSHG